MRILPPIVPSAALAAALAALTLGACASTGEGETYQQEYDRLNASCEARGGMLVPSSNPLSGRPATDYVCDIRDGGRLAAERANRD